MSLIAPCPQKAQISGAFVLTMVTPTGSPKRNTGAYSVSDPIDLWTMAPGATSVAACTVRIAIGSSLELDEQ